MYKNVLLNSVFIGVASMGIFSCFKKESKEEKFWSWFEKNTSILFNFETNQDKIFDDLSYQMNKVNLDLTFEFGPIENDKRDFVISAGGIKSAFPAVEKLYNTHPNMKEWNFIKYRPRRNIIHTISFQGKKVTPEEIKFALFKDENPQKIGILLFLKGYNQNEQTIFGQIAYLFLDEIIGEYDVETFVGAIEIQGFDSQYFDKALPINELVKAFDNEKK